MKIIKCSEQEHTQLKSSKTDEIFSRSAVLSKALGTDQLFIHHDILAPGMRSSGSHRHSSIDEVIYIIRGSATVFHGGKSNPVSEGDLVCFRHDDKEFHYLLNQTDSVVETLTFAVNDSSDRVVYETDV